MLSNFGASALTEDSAADVATSLKSLIGCFDLDPNRVFDLVLDRRGARAAALALFMRPRAAGRRPEATLQSERRRLGGGALATQHTMDRLF